MLFKSVDQLSKTLLCIFDLDKTSQLILHQLLIGRYVSQPSCLLRDLIDLLKLRAQIRPGRYVVLSLYGGLFLCNKRCVDDIVLY